VKAVFVAGRTSLPACARVGLEDDSVGRRGREFPTGFQRGFLRVELPGSRLSRFDGIGYLREGFWCRLGCPGRESAGNRRELSGPKEEPIPLPPYS
jgi:hypothetical protein